jgi:hypothetical protein
MYTFIEREEARLQGRKRYFTGRPCVHGHETERYVSTGACIACIDPVWRAIKKQVNEDVLKIHVKIPGTLSFEKRGEFAKWVQTACLDAFLDRQS